MLIFSKIIYSKKCYETGDHMGCINPENEYKYLIFQIDNKGNIKAWTKREF